MRISYAKLFLSVWTLSLLASNAARAQDILDFIPTILSAASSNGSSITDSQGNRCAISDNQRAILNLHNEARLSGRQCGVTFMPPAPVLRWSCPIASTASSHSNEMQANGNLSHSGNNGSNAGDRLLINGYNWSRWGENIAAGRTSASGTMAQWLGSAPHCANLMNANFEEMGVAQDDVVGNYWTAVFATR